MTIGMTHYYLREGETKVRHGHTNGQNDKEQWHYADAVHRDDPGGHIRDHSWDLNMAVREWSNKNYLSRDEKINLVQQAHYWHDRAQHGSNGWFATPSDNTDGWTRQYSAPVRENYFSTGPAPTSPTVPEPAPVPTTPPDLGRIIEAYSSDTDSDREEERSWNEPTTAPTPDSDEAPALEGTVDEQLAQLNERLYNVEDLAITLGGPFEQRISSLEGRQTETASRLDRFNEEVGQLQRQLGDVDVSKQLAPLAEKVAKLTARLDAGNAFTIIVKRNDIEHELAPGTYHKRFPRLLKYVNALRPERRNIWLAGPAGSGKSTAAKMLAQSLGLEYEYNNAVDSPYKLSGYRDAAGNYWSTQMRRRFEHGGVYLFDEVDGSSNSALLEANSALANGVASFPDGMVKRHENFIAICAANTWGLGGDANYVGRFKQDAAFLDRFVKLSWDYDEDLERAVAGPDEWGWVNVVQAVRASVFSSGAQMVISPRASYAGLDLLRGDCTPLETVEGIFGSYRQHDKWPQVGQAAEDFAQGGTSSHSTATGRASVLSSVNFSGVR